MNPLNILRDSWFFFSRNLVAIASFCLPLVLLESLAQLMIGGTGEERARVYEVLASLLFYPLYTGALILFLDARSQGYRPRSADLLAMSLRLWPTLAVLVGLSTLLIMLGASLFLLPGLWLMIRLAFGEILVVLRGMTPLAAMRESFRLTAGRRFWLVLGCVMAVMLPLWLFDWWSYRQLGEEPETLAAVLLDSFNGFLQLFANVVLFRLYMLMESRPAEA